MITGKLYNKQTGLIALRGISVFAKFLFTVLFFKATEAGFGEYSLVATSIILLVFVLGLDFYSYANRAILEPGSNPQKIIFNQFGLYFILYLILLPVIYLIFLSLDFDTHYYWYFYFILITEHFNTEFYRLLFVFKKPLAANINLFLRNGLWVWFAVLYMYFNEQVDLLLILKLWLIGNLLAVFYSLFISRRKSYKIESDNFKWDFKWIKTGIYVSIPYILGTIAYKTIEFSDRYMIDYFMDKRAVGVYSFFANMANVMNIVLFTAVISVLYPVLVESIMQKNQNKFKETYDKFRKELLYYGIGISFVLFIALPLILVWIGKTVYLHQFYIFFVLIMANMLLNFSFLHHFVIYAFKKDWKIFQATFVAAVINILLNLLLIPLMGILGASIATLISYFIIWYLKRNMANVSL